MNVKNTYLISVITPDRVGLTRDIAKTVFDLQGYISEMRQSIVSGFFSLIFVTEHSEDVGTKLHDSLRAVLPAGAELSIMADPEKIRKAMPAVGARYVVIASGVDRPGVMYRISDFMAAHNINIEDWSTIFDGDYVTHVAYATFRAPCTDLKATQMAFKKLMSEIEFSAQICHEDIFKATGEVAPIKSLTME